MLANQHPLAELAFFPKNLAIRTVNDLGNLSRKRSKCVKTSLTNTM